MAILKVTGKKNGLNHRADSQFPPALVKVKVREKKKKKVSAPVCACI